MFQHTAARRRLPRLKDFATIHNNVSTHSRAKAAARILKMHIQLDNVSTHSRAKAAAQRSIKNCSDHGRFNTQPREGGCLKEDLFFIGWIVFQHTAARRRLRRRSRLYTLDKKFQHTAARRRLPLLKRLDARETQVSTHSRAKAAAFVKIIANFDQQKFQHTAARRRLLGA